MQASTAFRFLSLVITFLVVAKLFAASFMCLTKYNIICILAREIKQRLAGFEDVILIQNGVEVTHEPQYVGFNEQCLNGPA